jgi:hypothetical protein
LVSGRVRVGFRVEETSGNRAGVGIEMFQVPILPLRMECLANGGVLREK